ncbi:MAG: hypothetical protein P8163_12910 [Candidatus Thiodiazotropha sp.]
MTSHYLVRLLIVSEPVLRVSVATSSLTLHCSACRFVIRFEQQHYLLSLARQVTIPGP